MNTKVFYIFPAPYPDHRNTKEVIQYLNSLPVLDPCPLTLDNVREFFTFGEHAKILMAVRKNIRDAFCKRLRMQPTVITAINNMCRKITLDMARARYQKKHQKVETFSFMSWTESQRKKNKQK